MSAERAGGHPLAGMSLVVAVLAVSWAAILIRLADAGPLAIAFWRLFIATLVVAPLAAATRRPRPDSKSAAQPASSRLVVAAGVLLAIHFALWVGSLFLTTVASSVTLVTTQPVFAALVSRPLLGERTARRTWAAIALSLAGAAVIGFGDFGVSMSALVGDLMALAAAAAAAFYLVLGRRARHGGPLPVYLVKVNAVAALALLVPCVVTGTRLGGFSGATWLVFAGLAVGPHLAGHGLLNFAVRHLRAPAVNLALLGEPVLSTVYAVFLFGERPSGMFLAGAALVIGGVLVEFVRPGGRT